MAWVHVLLCSCILSSCKAAAIDAFILQVVEAAPGVDSGLSLLQYRSRSLLPEDQVDADPIAESWLKDLKYREATEEVHHMISEIKEEAALLDADEKEADEDTIAQSFYATLAGAEAVNTSTILMAGKLRSPTAEEVNTWAEETKNLSAKMKAKRKAEAEALAADKALEEKLYEEHQRNFDIAFAKGTAEKEKAEKAARKAAEASAAAAKAASAEHKAAKKEVARKREAHKSAAKKASAKKKAAEKAAFEKLSAEQKALEKAAQERAAKERASAAKAVEKKAAAERAAAEEAAEEKATEERAALREAARKKAEADRAAEEAAAEEATEEAAAQKAHLKEEAEVTDLEEAAIEKAQAYAAAAARARAEQVFEKLEHTKCGWMVTDFSCQWDNQAFINEGSRVKSRAIRKSALESCAEICDAAGEDCGGFTWIAEESCGEDAGEDCRGSCYFRKDVTCGRTSEANSDCYIKRVLNASAQELKDEDAQVTEAEKDAEKKLIVFRAQDSSCDGLDGHCVVKVEETMPGLRAQEPWVMSHQSQLQDDASNSTMRDVFFKAKDTNCGWWEIDDGCAWLNLARVNDGLSVAEAKSSEEALEYCGGICDDAGDACGGFTWKDQQCYFRVNAKCGVMTLPGSDCYVKHSLLVLPHSASDEKADESSSTKKVVGDPTEKVVRKDDTKQADSKALLQAADEEAIQDIVQRSSAKNVEHDMHQQAVPENEDLAEKAQKLLAQLEADEKAAEESVLKAASEVAEQDIAEEWQSVKVDLKAKQELAMKRSQKVTAYDKLRTHGHARRTG